jgi:hypothetical protein
MDEPKAVLAQLPAPAIKHGAKLKEIRNQWDTGCARILQNARLSSESKIQVVGLWLQKANVRDYVLGQMLLKFSRPLPPKPTDEQVKDRQQKALVRLAYVDDLPHLKAVHTVVGNRLDDATTRGIHKGSLAKIDELEDRETTVMFAEFAASIDEQVALQYRAADDNGPFADAAE